MTVVLLLCLTALALSPSEGSVVVEARFLDRGDLPNEFRFPVLELDFVVLHVKLRNESQQDWALRAQELVLRDPKGKTLTRVGPSEVTPKIVKSKIFRRYNLDNRQIHGEVGYNPPRVIYGPASRNERVPDTPSPPRTISLNTAKRIRSILEKHELKETTLAPGEALVGLVYFKSKKPASKLSGSTLILDDKLRVKIP
ncbi:hypothetical protein MYX84_09815 [Acidobacteria bacterium AH-259-O06]|nr:hypothetical protein [Acidobacteria bacterium AH-259-O06]